MKHLKGIGLLIIVFTNGIYFHGWSQNCKPNLSLGDTISFCTGNSLTLNATNPNSTYIWNTGATTPTLNVRASGEFWVAATNVCGTSRDTVFVIVDKPVNIDLGPDRALCQGTTTTLSAPSVPGAYYLWQDGTLGDTYTVSDSGTYYVSISNACGVYSDTVVIRYDTAVTLDAGADRYVCTSDSITIGVAPTGYEVIWNNGMTGDTITVNSSGNYVATINNSCGSFSDDINITYSNGNSLDIGDTTFLCQGNSILLSSNISGGQYLWNTGTRSATLAVNQPGTFWLRYSDACGSFYDTVTVLSMQSAALDLGEDTTVCQGQQVRLNAGPSSGIYYWNTGATTPSITVVNADTYWVRADFGCGFQYDTISVHTSPTPYNFTGTKRVAICQGSNYTLDAGGWGPQTTYLWDDGSTSRTNTYSSGIYHWAVVSNPCGIDTVKFNLIYDNPRSIELPPGATLCDESVWLNISNKVAPDDTVLWSTGNTDPVQLVKNSGTYWVKVSNGCGVFADTVIYTFLGPPGKIRPQQADLCAGGSIRLSLSSQPFTQYLWSNGSTSNSITVNQPGTYWVTAGNNCSVSNDTVQVIQDQPLNVDLGSDLYLCKNQQHTLSVEGYAADSIRWSNGSTMKAIDITKSGTYWVNVYNACGAFRDTIQLTFNKPPERKLKNKVYCSGGQVQLNATQAGSSYFWSTGATSPSISVSSPGWYFVDITNMCGNIRDSVFLTSEQILNKPDLGKDTIFCEGELLLDPVFVKGATYTWQDGSNSRQFLVKKSGTYYVSVSNSCNTVSDTIEVLITGPPKEVLGNKVRFCWGNLLTLNAQNPGSNYLWNTGDRSSSLTVDSAGIYWCTITNACGTYTDTVHAIVEYQLQDLSIGKDTVICEGDDFYLSTNYPDLQVQWHNHTGLDSIRVEETGTYWAMVKNSCGRWYDSAYVEVLSVPEFSLGPDTVMCEEGGSMWLSGPEGMKSYVWSNGDSVRSAFIQQPGTYWLTVENSCFSYTDTIEVRAEHPLELDLGADTTLCMDQVYVIKNYGEGSPLYWDNGARSEVREVSRTGTYWGYARNSCGVFYDTIAVTFDPYIDESPVDTLVCQEDEAVFDLSELGYEFEWFDGSKEAVRNFPNEGSYSLTITNKCGTFAREYIVNKHNCDCPLYVPNSFTPNGDGVNEEFFIGYNCDIRNYKLEIFNRWGELIHETENLEDRWNGRDTHGRAVMTGVYSYRIVYEWHVYGLDRHRRLYGSISLLK